jgi:hypothetical protein
MATGTYGNVTAGHISFDSGDGNVKLLTIPNGCTSVTIQNTSTSGFGTQFFYIWIPGIHKTQEGQDNYDIDYAQWALVFPPKIGVPSVQTFTCRPNEITEVWGKTTASSGQPCVGSFAVSESSLTNNFRTKQSVGGP